jgi:addiction module RelE/StbE family toxin
MSSTSQDSAPRRVKFEISSEFGDTYRDFLKQDPRIKGQLTIFNQAKRTIPPTELPLHFRDHALHGVLAGVRECHLAHDILLLYTHKDDVVRLLLVCDHDALQRGSKAKATAARVRSSK